MNGTTANRIVDALMLVPAGIGMALVGILFCAVALVIGLPYAIYSTLRGDDVTDEEYWADMHHRTCIPSDVLVL